MKEQFINRYKMSKTLRFSLIPVGKTEENFNSKKLLEEDRDRAEKYENVKKYIDRYHRAYIDRILSDTKLKVLNEYSDLYFHRTEDSAEQLKRLEGEMRKQIADELIPNKKNNRLIKKEIITEDLPSFLQDEEELKEVKDFAKFTVYFRGFNENRGNMYTDEPEPTAISYRCINENLPKFLDNIKSFAKVSESLPSANMDELNEDYYALYGHYVTDIFSVDFFNFVLVQTGIDMYNSILGGYTCEDGTKVKGLNEYINLYNQQIAKKDKSLRLPFMKPLYKQILSDNEKWLSFIPKKFGSDDELLAAVKEYYHGVLHKKDELSDCDFSESLTALFSDLKTFDLNGIFVKNGPAITDISNAVYGKWSAVRSAWEKEYEESNPIKKKTNIEKYNEARNKKFKATKSFSLSKIQKLGAKSSDCACNLSDWYTSSVAERMEKIEKTYGEARELVENGYAEKYDLKLCRNENATEIIKNFLDSVKELELLIKPLTGAGTEENKEGLFYGEFDKLFSELSSVDKLYDKVRNYMTQKPYSKEKIKLNFQNPQFLGGWDKNKERDYSAVILRKNGNYYLAVMDKSHNKVFEHIPKSDGVDCYEKMEYKLLPDPKRMLPKVFFAASNTDIFSPSDRILDIRKRGSFKKGQNFNLGECHELIDFYKSSISKHKDWSKFGFKFSPTEQYNDITEFYDEVGLQGYSLRFTAVSTAYIETLVEKGYIYLFQIYNKDFSEHSHGKQNLHTLYFKMLFDERNLSDVVYKLSGGAEMFYREASIGAKEQIVHPKNIPLNNKNEDNEKKTSIFEYDLIKDRRYTKRQFSLHLPIEINFNAAEKDDINLDVRKAVKSRTNNCVIGIDRGERNLLYISVVDENGHILEQISLNEIVSDNNYRVDYQKLLNSREKARDEARKSWKTVENIKELKEGYLSQAIHKICELVLKYDAVIAMEDLNFGFKRGRFNVEKQVYQKFENMLISKLNLLTDKTLPADSDGGLLRAYQLTNKVEGKNTNKQSGIIFYVPAWDTSKIDPVTGFVNLLNTKYTSVSESQKFFGTVDDIRYNKSSDMFEFDIDYSKFPKCNADFKKKWTVCSNGERIESFRNEEKNSEWDSRKLVLTDEFKKLFAEFEIDISTNLKESILNNAVSEFHRRLMKLFAQTLQMRNSVSGSTRPEDDYLISPVADENGKFFDSRNYTKESALPCDADANGAYNIARKALWAIDVLKNTADEDLDKANLSIPNAKWLEFVQK